MILKEKIQEVPIIRQPMIYFGVVLSFLIVIMTPILSSVPNKELIIVMYYGSLLIFTVTIGFKEFVPFYNKSENFFNLMKQAINIFICSWILRFLVMFLLTTNDPQQLGQYSYPFSWSLVVHMGVKFLLAGIAEEIFKVCLFLLFYWLFAKVIKNRVTLCVISVLITSSIFGLLHINYNPSEWLAITITTGTSAVVYFYFLLAYQSIIPLMLAHALSNFIVWMNLIEGIDVQSIFACIVFISFLVSTIKDFKKTKEKCDTVPL